MIRVLELIDGGFIGGGQTHILSVTKNIDRTKFETLIAASPNGEFKELAEVNGIEFEDLILPKRYHSKCLTELHEIIGLNEIDIIHSHGGVAGMYARFYKKKYPNTKVIHTIHGIHYIHTNFFRKFFTQSIEQFLAPYADRYICVSDSDFEIAKRLKIIDPGKTIVIKNGIDLKKFERKPKDPGLLSKYNISESDLIIGNISRFDYQKNQKFIIKNSNSLFEKYPDLKIMLAGDGKYLEYCKYLAKKSGNENKFIFTGEITNPSSYYSLFDIFIFPSLWEGLSIALIEAMASANCIIASDIDANKELIEDGKTGMLFNTNHPNEYLEKIINLIENPNQRKTLSNNALQESPKYSEQEMTKMIEEEYLKLA